MNATAPPYGMTEEPAGFYYNPPVNEAYSPDHNNESYGVQPYNTAMTDQPYNYNPAIADKPNNLVVAGQPYNPEMAGQPYNPAVEGQLYNPSQAQPYRPQVTVVTQARQPAPNSCFAYSIFTCLCCSWPLG